MKQVISSKLFFLGLLTGLMLASNLYAQSAEPKEIEEILVWGRETDLVGSADSASDGIVGYADILDRPLTRVGELVEFIPGMIAVMHSSGGKANQYFLRGINLDHGSDFSINFDGMPVNFRSHAHGNGYLDMNFIIPELIETIAYSKGTHHAEKGDFSSAGSSDFKTYDQLEHGTVKLTWGSEKLQRLFMADSWDTGSGTFLMGATIKKSDGPWKNPEDTQLFNGIAKYTTTLKSMDAKYIATIFNNKWNATDQIPLRAIKNGTLDRFGSIDPSVGGKSSRFNFIMNLSGESTDYKAFLSRYSLNLFQNPTYFLGDSVNGDQMEQVDSRWIAGGSILYERSNYWFGKENDTSLGMDIRYDSIDDVSVYATSQRTRLSTHRRDKVKEFSLGFFAKTGINWSEKLRTTVGLRGDYYSWDVSALNPLNSGRNSDVIVNPKFDFVYLINDSTEVYVNHGTAFHSNDVRGSEITIDPLTLQSVEKSDVLVKTKGSELGFRTQITDHMNLSLTLFELDLNSALIFSGDAGVTEPTDGVISRGVEIAFFAHLFEQLAIDITAAKNIAKFKDVPSNLDAVPDAHDFILGASIMMNFNNSLKGVFRIRHFGDAPLVEDNSIKKPDVTLVNFGLSYPFKNSIFEVEVINLFDKKANDIEYFYESQLLNELQPIDDYHFHPALPREIRLSVSYNF
jgi:hypothetical protein